MTTTAARLPDVDTGKRSGAILAVILAGQFMAVLDASIVNIAIPSIRASLHASGSALQLIVGGYVVAYAVLLVTGARLGDRLTQRTMFLGGLAAFTTASLACGLAWSTGTLIAFRCLQGAGAAAMVPQVMTMIQRTFVGESRARALSAYAAIISGAMVVGQVLGGLIVSADLFGSSWRCVFLVNVPIGVALFAVARRVLPVPATTFTRQLDLPGLALLTPAVLLVVLPLVLGHEQHWPVWTWIALACSLAGFAALWIVERRVDEPLFAPRVLQAPGLVLTAATLFVVMATFGAWLFVMALYLQGSLGYSALHAGLLFIPMASTFALASLNWQKIPERFHATMIPSGLVLAAATMATLGYLLRDGAGMGPLELVVFGLMGVGFGLSFSPLMNRSLGRVPVALAADASGILTTNVQLGIVVGVASFGSVFLSLHGSPAHAVMVTAVAEGCAVLLSAALALRAGRQHGPRC
jgi:EmrB/QacA subfamily drug resistance transporter